MRWRSFAAALLSAVCAHPLRPNDDSVFTHEAEAFAYMEGALSSVPRCRPRRYWTEELSAKAQRAAEALGQQCPGPHSAVLGLGTFGPPSSEGLAALSRALSATGVPCELLSHGATRKALQNTTLIVLGDSTMNEDWHYLTWMLFPESVEGKAELAYTYFDAATRMPEGMAPLLGRRLPDDPDGPGLGMSACYTIEDPNGPEVRTAFCPNHRRGETVLEGPGGRAETAVVTRFTGHHLIEGGYGGIDSYFQPEVRREWTMMVRRAIRRGHKVVIVIGTGQHDMFATMMNAYQLGLKNRSDPNDGVPTIELAYSRFRAQMEHLAERLARFQRAGAHVIWRGCNHGRGYPGVVLGTQNPGSHYSMLRRIDRMAKEVFDKYLRPFGAHYLNVTEITRVFMGDGGWIPGQGFFMDRRPWPIPFTDGFHMGAIQRYQGAKRGSVNASMEISGLIVQGMLNLAAYGCPGVPRDTP